ncbi:uncharacterized protein LOC129220024 [Uloborus diversus]|uniref:uncharacterized protein LOC129220024 n=1 Tax=Uloborus diversus TaxID=327109 RepID=UPI002409AE91|nr:uncharacterized protein LOC129220024 [Uloborus diversus]
MIPKRKLRLSKAMSKPTQLQFGFAELKEHKSFKVMANVKHCKFKICCLILIFLPFSSSAANDRIGNSSISHEDILKRWTEFESAAKTGIRYAVKSVLPSLMEAATKLELSAQCMNNGMLLLNNMMKLKPWAIRFIDSSAKSIDGLMGGTLSSLGSFDECLETEAISDRRKDKILFRGQYCTINMKPPLPPLDRFYKLGESMDELKNFTKRENIISDLSKIAHTFYFLSIRLGICVPSGCSTEDIDKVSKAGRLNKSNL